MSDDRIVNLRTGETYEVTPRESHTWTVARPSEDVWNHEEIGWRDGEYVFRGSITDEMVERAARLDHATDGEAWGSRETWDDLGEKGQRDYLDHARRLLEAALSPSS